MRSVTEFQFAFNSILTKDINAFNKLVKSLSLQPVEIYNLLNENFVVNVNQISIDNLDESNILLSTYPELRNVNSYEEVIEKLKQSLWMSSGEEVEVLLATRGIKKENLFTKSEVKSKAHFYTELVLNHWIKKINSSVNLDYFISNGISQNSLGFLAEHLSKIVTSRGLKDKLERILNDIVSEIFIDHNIKVFLAETFCLLINEIVISFDVQYFSKEELAEIELLKDVNNFKFYHKTVATDSQTINNLFGDSSDLLYSVNTIVLDKYNKWLEFFRISLLVNCGFVNYDEHANNNLRGLINEYKEFKLS